MFGGLAIWETTEISLFGSLVFSLIAFTLLYLFGFGFLYLLSKVSKRIDFMSELDPVQKFTFRAFFGFVFAFLFLLVFSISGFSFSTITILVISITIVLPLILYGWSIRHGLNFNWFKRVKLQSWLLGAIIVVVLAVTMFYSSSLVAGLYGSTNDDGAFHTNIVRIVIDNPSSLVTRSTAPYGEFINIYPSLSHAISALFVSTLNVPIQSIIVLFSVLLPTLIALAIYSTVKCMFGSTVLSVCGMIVSSFFSMAFTWGPLSWAGLPLMLSFFVSVCSMGIIFLFFEKREKNWLDALLVGFCFFLAVNTYPVALLIVFLWFILLLAKTCVGRLRHVRALPRRFYNKIVDKRNLMLFTALLIPILFSVPYFYTAFTHSTSYLQNFPSDVRYNDLVSGTNFLNDLVRMHISFNWIVDLPALASFFSVFDPFFAVAAAGIVLLALLYLVRAKIEFFSKRFLTSWGLIYLFLMFVLAVLALMVFVPISFLSLFNTERIWEHLFIPSLLLTSIVLFVGGYLFYVFVKRMAKTTGLSHKRSLLTKMLVGVLLFVIISNVGITTIPFINSAQGNYRAFRGYLEVYNSLHSDDIKLMDWMKNNIPSDSKVLVSSGDSGQYLEAVTQLRTIYSYDMRIFSQRYLDLMRYMTSNAFDSRAIDLLQYYNISYVYVGSSPTTYGVDYSFRDTFNVTELLSLPCFSVAYHVGNACLLHFDSSANPSTYKTYYSSDLAYFWDDRYQVSHVINGIGLCETLSESNFTSIDADELPIWLNSHINDNTSAGSTLIMTMGVTPDTIVDLSGSTLLKSYLQAGGRVIWVGDVPFYCQCHSDGSTTEWGTTGALNVLGVNFQFWDYNATNATVTAEGSRWGLSLNDTSTCQRLVSPSEVSLVFSDSGGYAASWLKNYNSAYPNSGFIRYSYADFNGTDITRVQEILNLAAYPLT